MYEHCKSSLFGVFWKDWVYIAVIAILAECTGVYLSIYIFYLASYILDESQHYTRGIWLVVIFFAMNLVVIVFRNRYIQYGYMTSIRMRRTLVNVMFDKVAMLTLEGLQRTNSGKIITLISSDLFAIERMLTFVPMVFVLPIANVFCYLLIGFNFGWWSSLIVFLCFVVALTIQLTVGG